MSYYFQYSMDAMSELGSYYPTQYSMERMQSWERPIAGNHVMAQLNESSLRHLATVNHGPCVSLYMPARKTGANSTIDVARLKNLIRTAERRLADGTFGTDGHELLTPVRALLDDKSAWNDSVNGLAVFVSPEVFRTFRVPMELHESVTVADRFDVAQILALGVEDGRYLLLSLSQNHIQLFRGSHQEFEPIALEKHLGSLDSFMHLVAFTYEPQMHSGARNVSGMRSKKNVVFHGNEMGATRKKEDLHEFFRAIDNAIAHVPGSATLPLVLVGADFVRAIYKTVSRHKHIVRDGVDVSVDHVPTKELHARSWKLAETYFQRMKNDALNKLRSFTGTGFVLDDPHEIMEAAHSGRIETLFVAVPKHSDGLPDSAHDELMFKRNKSIGVVLANSGQVYSVNMNELGSLTGVAALLRY